MTLAVLLFVPMSQPLATTYQVSAGSYIAVQAPFTAVKGTGVLDQAKSAAHSSWVVIVLTHMHCRVRMSKSVCACCCVPAGQKMLPPKFRLLDRDGIAAVGDYILPGDIYLNIQRPTNTRDPIQPNMPDSFYR